MTIIETECVKMLPKELDLDDLKPGMVVRSVQTKQIFLIVMAPPVQAGDESTLRAIKLVPEVKGGTLSFFANTVEFAFGATTMFVEVSHVKIEFAI